MSGLPGLSMSNSVGVRAGRVARSLDPTFLTSPELLNSYSYAVNNPVSYVDPDGAVAVVAYGLIVGAAFGFGYGAGTQIGTGKTDLMGLAETTAWGAAAGLTLGLAAQLAAIEAGLAALSLPSLPASIYTALFSGAAGGFLPHVKEFLRRQGYTEKEIQRLEDALKNPQKLKKELLEENENDKEQLDQGKPVGPSSGGAPSGGTSGGNGGGGGAGVSNFGGMPSSPGFTPPSNFNPPSTPRITYECVSPLFGC